MTSSPLDSALYGPLFGDPETAELLSDAAQIRALLRVEAALARVEGRLGVIPAEAAVRIAEVAACLDLDPAALADGTASAGVPVPALAAALQNAVGNRAAPYVHWGATSQDIIDTALILRLRDILALFAGRLDAIIADLAIQADRYRAVAMAGRTRSQIATPITFGLKIATWLAPLLRHRDRLAELRPRLEVVQFGGASGTLAALGDRGLAVMDALARDLGLASPVLPWHSQGDRIAEVGGWLALVSGSLGKMGADVVLLGQSEVGELAAGAGGGSSTMPNKSNPVGAETLVALARHNAGLLGTLHQSLIQEHERDGIAWPLSWLSLPPMLMACGGALRHARHVSAHLLPDVSRMAERLDATDGLVLAEAASFLLCAHMPRAQAQDLVKACCREALGAGRHLFDVLAQRTTASVDWQAAREEPSRHVGAAEALVQRLLDSIPVPREGPSQREAP
jgi:3-carboxy-cis,cis-muconate cycloisomerase